MIQDIGPHQLENHYFNKQASPASQLLIFDGRQIFSQAADCLKLPTLAQYEEFQRQLGFHDNNYRYLFTIGDQDYFLPDPPKEILPALAELGCFLKLFALRRLGTSPQVLAAVTAWHLYSWYHASRFCGVCGSPTVHDEKERMMRCPYCGNMIFPKIAPAVIVGVRNGDKLLLSKYAGREYKRYALIAGFAEIGETIEQTVAREVFEETGVKVKNITYYKSQPWGFDSNLLLGFYCDLDGDETITVDHEELALAQWVAAQDIPESHEGISLTEEMMMNFKQAHKQ